MNFNMNIPGLKDVEITKIEELEVGMAISIELPRQAHQSPAGQQWTLKVHDYRIQKIKHLKWFERMTVILYKCRRYACGCRKRFAEKVSFIERYQRFTK